MVIFYLFLVFLFILLCILIYNYIQRKNHLVKEGLESAPAPPEENAPSESAASESEPSPPPSAPAPAAPVAEPATVMINAANIAFLKTKVDDLAGIKERVAKLEEQTAGNGKAIMALALEKK